MDRSQEDSYLTPSPSYSDPATLAGHGVPPSARWSVRHPPRTQTLSQIPGMSYVLRCDVLLRRLSILWPSSMVEQLLLAAESILLVLIPDKFSQAHGRMPQEHMQRTNSLVNTGIARWKG